MPQISTLISDDLNKRLRDEVSRRFGAYKRGSLQKAIIEALEMWIVADVIKTVPSEKSKWMTCVFPYKKADQDSMHAEIRFLKSMNSAQRDDPPGVHLPVHVTYVWVLSRSRVYPVLFDLCYATHISEFSRSEVNALYLLFRNTVHDFTRCKSSKYLKVFTKSLIL